MTSLSEQEFQSGPGERAGNATVGPMRGPDRAGPPGEAGRLARWRSQKGHDLHRTPAARADQRIDLEDPAQHLGPAPACLPERERHGLRDVHDVHGRRLRCATGHVATPNPRGPTGVPSIGARQDLSPVRDVRHQPGEELHSVNRLGPGGTCACCERQRGAHGEVSRPDPRTTRCARRGAGRRATARRPRRSARRGSPRRRRRQPRFE
jgi:hypothetical protein